MTHSSELFRALELAHYADRFRSKLFVIGLQAETPFQDLLLDLKVLAGYRIRVVLVLPDPENRLEQALAVFNRRGTRFHLCPLSSTRATGPAPAQDLTPVAALLEQGLTPVIAFPGKVAEAAVAFSPAADVAAGLAADKLFLVTPLVEKLRALVGRSHLLAGELPGLMAQARHTAPQPTAALLAFVHAQLERGIPDIVLIAGQPAQLFREVFTHDGAGILFNRTSPARIRPADMGDVTDIGLLLKPEIAAGRILPTDEDAIASAIQHYWVYEIDGLLVCSACLRPYGDEAELAQVAALPRYRGKGRARELVARMLEHAVSLGLERVFALSVDDGLRDFFLGLDFHETERGRLPEAWRTRYDMSRPSRAYLKEL